DFRPVRAGGRVLGPPRAFCRFEPPAGLRPTGAGPLRASERLRRPRVRPAGARPPRAPERFRRPGARRAAGAAPPRALDRLQRPRGPPRAP
ncbi:unnamed protein product, partial [Prorocentrum cordatum]